jgi:hypothetical protein
MMKWLGLTIAAIILAAGGSYQVLLDHPSRTLASVAEAGPQPHGPGGYHGLLWSDEFDGATIDASKWTRPVWHVQNVDTDPTNAWLYGGKLVLNLSSRSRGALVRSIFQFRPGMIAEARVRFPGGADPIWNWPGWWAAGFRYPDSGEHDIAEGLARGLKISYWDGSRQTPGPNFGRYPAGEWGSAYHTYTLWRRAGEALVYWDGRLVARYATNDDGGPEALLVSLGSTPGESPVLGHPSRVRIDYVRVWRA